MANETNKKDKRFFKDFKAELKKVIWPSTKQLVNNTTAVIAIVLIIAVIVFALDVDFESMNTYGIDRIKSLVTSTQSSDENIDNQEVVENTNTTTDNTQVEATALPDVVTENTTTDENETTEDTGDVTTDENPDETVENEE